MIQDTLTRRDTLKAIGVAGAAAVLPSRASAEAESHKIKDADIFNFALNLESLETEYCLMGSACAVLATVSRRGRSHALLENANYCRRKRNI